MLGEVCSGQHKHRVYRGIGGGEAVRMQHYMKRKKKKKKKKNIDGLLLLPGETYARRTNGRWSVVVVVCDYIAVHAGKVVQIESLLLICPRLSILHQISSQ